MCKELDRRTEQDIRNGVVPLLSLIHIYGVYLQFWVRRGASEVPLGAAMPQNVAIAGIDPADLIGIHTYCRDADIEAVSYTHLDVYKRQPWCSRSPPFSCCPICWA